MKTLIYQYWQGPVARGVQSSMDNIKAYAERIGADYRLDLNKPQAVDVCGMPMRFEWLNPMIDPSFWEYDKIAIIDCDIWCTDNLTESVFDDFTAGVGACREPFIEWLRGHTLHGHINSTQDERWATKVKELNVEAPRNEQGKLKVYNAGMVLFSKEGLKYARENWLTFKEYIDFMKGYPPYYTEDQAYLHTMCCGFGTDFQELDYSWNSQVHHMSTRDNPTRRMNDTRPDNVRLVHLQCGDAAHFTEEELYRVVNLPFEEWDLDLEKYRAGLRCL